MICFDDMDPIDERQKPECELSNSSGNIFVMVGKAGAALKKAGMEKERQALYEEVPKCNSYDEAIRCIMKYVDVI